MKSSRRAGKTFPRKPTASSAFSLAESAVGIAIAGILFVALYAGIAHGFATIRLSRESLRATQILQDRFETIRLYNWNQVNSNAFLLPNFRVPLYADRTNAGYYEGTVRVSLPAFAEPYTNQLRLVTVQLSWTNGQRRATREMTSLVARYGLQSYVFYYVF